MKLRFRHKGKKNIDKKINFSLFSIYHFLFAFFVFGSIITVCFFLFFNNGLSLVFDIMELNDEIKKRAVQTFNNLLFISLLVTVAYNIFKWFSVKIPITRLLDATHKITEGDFSARVNLYRPFGTVNEFDVLARDFNRMAEELSSIETLKNDFIANVSHEMKTPLAVINSYATIIQNPDINDDERAEYAGIIANASSNLSELISSILRLNKLENQQIFPQKFRYNLSEQLCECMLNFESEWENKKLNIETEFDEDVVVDADGELLSLVWSNLISNAVKFCDEGDTVYVSLEKEKENAVVKIRDTGCGMSEDVIKRIFEKFYQGDSSRATKGNGLGLALVKRVIDITESEIVVESEEGEGTEFTVKVPLE
ncbi:MAG: HAMP domain-containing histidine kinase [Clostridia bacterium]|nr:HAMP domain-containing histidine kinase [Clostridia bacterium]